MHCMKKVPIRAKKKKAQCYWGTVWKFWKNIWELWMYWGGMLSCIRVALSRKGQIDERSASIRLVFQAVSKIVAFSFLSEQLHSCWLKGLQQDSQRHPDWARVDIKQPEITRKQKNRQLVLHPSRIQPDFDFCTGEPAFAKTDQNAKHDTAGRSQAQVDFYISWNLQVDAARPKYSQCCKNNFEILNFHHRHSHYHRLFIRALN